MLNWLDIFVGIALVIALINGYKKGLVMQAVGLVSIVLAAIFGGKLAKIILPELLRLLHLSPNIAGVLSYIFAFALIAVVMYLIGNAIQKFLQAVNLNFINRVLGGIIAMATTMVVLSILLNLTLMIDPYAKIIKPSIRAEAFFYERVKSVVPAIVPYLNKEVWEQYVPEKYKEQTKENPAPQDSIAPSKNKTDI